MGTLNRVFLRRRQAVLNTPVQMDGRGAEPLKLGVCHFQRKKSAPGGAQWRREVFSGAVEVCRQNLTVYRAQ